jgi:ADP-heptose:LPS heptosyltransferase
VNRPGAVVPGVGRLAVLRANAVGDFLLALPALEALRAAYPDAELVLLGSAWHREFLAGRPGPVDRCVAVPPSTGVRDDRPPAPARVLDEFFAAMRAERFDLAMQLHGGGASSNPFTARLGARVTAGARAPDAPGLDRTVAYAPYQPEVLRLLEVVALVGAAPVTLAPSVAVTGTDRAESHQVLPDDGRPLVALHPGANDGRRCWPPERFAAVAAELGRKGARVLVVGGATDRPAAARVAASAGGEAEDLAGRLSLGGLAGLLERCRLLLSNDSGPRHLAAAVGTPTVGIYWCVNLPVYGPLLRAGHRVLVSWQLACLVCGADCTLGPCGHRESFLTGVGVEEVLAETLDLYGSR